MRKRRSKLPFSEVVDVGIGQVAAIAVWLSLGCSFVMAQTKPFTEEIDTPGLMIEAVVGLGGIVDRSTPTVFSFLIRNNSDRNLEGSLTLHDIQNRLELVLGDVMIAPGTSRRFTSIQSIADWNECYASINFHGQVLWRRELNFTTGRQLNRQINFVLFIDEKGRKLQLPGSLTEIDSTSNTSVLVPGLSGRPIRCLSVKPWQLPNHPGPLVAARAIVFPEGATERELNRMQWRSIAEWMCQGGTIFIHHQSNEVIDRLRESAPLGTEVAFSTGPFMVRRFGLGSLYEYSQPIMSSDENSLRQSIAQATANLDGNQINQFSDHGLDDWQYIDYGRVGRADRNRIWVMVFFGLYIVLSGAITLLLFRLNQRRITVYITVVVIGTSVLAAGLGGFLRMSKGDLSWLSVTEAGIGGLVQVGSIKVHSAGSRNSRIAIRGERVDLQHIATGFSGLHWVSVAGRQFYERMWGYSPFTWQQNEAGAKEDIYQINVPMVLWGRRTCHANAFQRGSPRMDFELGFERREFNESDEDQKQLPIEVPNGMIKLKLVNQLPFDLKDCWLVIGTSQPYSPNSALKPGGTNAAQNDTASYAQNLYRQNNSGTAVTPIDGLIDVYHCSALGNISTHSTCEKTFPAKFQSWELKWEIMNHMPQGTRLPPPIPRMGTASAWIIGRIEKSPIMQIDEQHSDFVELRQIHHFVQEILPEDLSDSLHFWKGVKPVSNAASDDKIETP